jgi:[acyl-carrier-protein] S-malonyltransferase
MTPTIFLFPGQGSHMVGMAGEFIRERPSAATLAERADRVLGRPLSRTMLRGPLATLTHTSTQQVAICLAEAICLAVVLEMAIAPPVAAAGHSLGELTACYAAGAIDFETLMVLAAERGRLMNSAAEAQPGGMLALSPATEDEAVRLIAAAGGAIMVANLNAPGQVVLSGSRAALVAVESLARSAGIRATWLAVSGPWHSPAMIPAARAFADVLRDSVFGDASVPVWSALDATPERRAAALITRLARQIDHPVRWEAMVRRLREAHPDALLLEIGPGKVLTGLTLAIDPRSRVARVADPLTLAAARRAIGLADTASIAARD